MGATKALRDYRRDDSLPVLFLKRDRRRSKRGAADTEPERHELVTIILGMYRETPGLWLHVNQAAQLLGVRPATCRIVLEDLVRDGHLRHALDGQYTTL